MADYNGGRTLEDFVKFLEPDAEEEAVSPIFASIFITRLTPGQVDFSQKTAHPETLLTVSDASN